MLFPESLGRTAAVWGSLLRKMQVQYCNSKGESKADSAVVVTGRVWGVAEILYWILKGFAMVRSDL